jgi:hypothetical protein
MVGISLATIHQLEAMLHCFAASDPGWAADKVRASSHSSVVALVVAASD